MSKAWITNLQRLMAQDVTETDMLVVKLLTIDTYDGIVKVSTDMYPARIIHKKRKIEWHINDYLDDFLIIDTDDISAELGHVDIDEHLTHIITGCYVFKHRTPRANYRVIDKTTEITITTAETRHEANNIKRALTSRKINTKILRKV